MKYRIKQHPTINDYKDTMKMMNDFALWPSIDLYECADVSVLLVESTESCGVSYVDSSMDCHTASIVQKSCALGAYT